MKKPTSAQWIAGARPHTLPLSIVPVLLGIACVMAADPGWWDRWPIALLCLLVAITLQVGVNYANDYSDGIRGTDKKRVGPLRLVGSGLAQPRAVLTAAITSFGVAAVLGFIIIAVTSHWWLLLVGVLCLLAGWYYTGGKRPYGYTPFSEPIVILFFGIIPTVGTMYALTGVVSLNAWMAGLAAGFFAAAVLMANNIRDRERDAQHGKRTLSVVAGPVASRYLYSLFVLVPFVTLMTFVAHYPAAILVYAALLFLTIPTIGDLSRAKTGPDYVVVLQRTVILSLAYGLGLTLVIFLS